MNSNRDRRIHSRLFIYRYVWEPDKECAAHGLPYLEILKGWLKDSIFTRQHNQKWSIKNSHFKKFQILIWQYNNSLRAPWKRCAKIKPKSKHGTKESWIEPNGHTFLSWLIENSINCYTTIQTIELTWWCWILFFPFWPARFSEKF